MNGLEDSANTERCTLHQDSANFLKDERFTKTEYQTSANLWKMNAEDKRITTWVSASKWGKTEASASKRGKCVSTSQKNLPYQLHRTPNNAQNSQQKLGVASSYLERNKISIFKNKLSSTHSTPDTSRGLPLQSC